jgi:hypothetical protein
MRRRVNREPTTRRERKKTWREFYFDSPGDVGLLESALPHREGRWIREGDGSIVVTNYSMHTLRACARITGVCLPESITAEPPREM